MTRAVIGLMDVLSFPVDSTPCLEPLRRYLGHKGVVTALGNPEILNAKLLALFCSVKCPGKLILETYDLTQQLKQERVAVIGGFHSPMERECLEILLRGTAPVVVCPARSIAKMRVRPEFREPLENGRLLFLSPFDHKERRATQENAMARNRFVAALADAIFVAYAAPGGKTEDFCRNVLAWGKRVFIFDSPENAQLILLGVTPVAPDSVPHELRNLAFSAWPRRCPRSKN